MTLRQRVICPIAAFTSIDSHGQCREFFGSALNVGPSREEMREAIMRTGPYTGFPRALDTLVSADEVLSWSENFPGIKGLRISIADPSVLPDTICSQTQGRRP